jgi:hypothetical protein
MILMISVEHQFAVKQHLFQFMSSATKTVQSWSKTSFDESRIRIRIISLMLDNDHETNEYTTAVAE